LKQIPDRIQEDNGGDVAFIIKDASGVNIFMYYEEGKLKYLFPTTPGRDSKRTPPNLIVSNIVDAAHYFYYTDARGNRITK